MTRDCRGSLGLLGCAAAVLAVAGCSTAGDRLKGQAPRNEVFVGDVSLPEVRPGREDRPFSFRAEPDGLLFVYFGFTSCPDVCPTTLSDLRDALDELGPDAARVGVAFVTVDPYRDTTEVLVPYLASYFAGAHALYPRTQEQLARAETAYGASSTASRRPDGTVEVSHTTAGYIVDDTGHVRVQWPFGLPPDDMAHDMRRLLAARSGGGT